MSSPPVSIDLRSLSRDEIIHHFSLCCSSTAFASKLASRSATCNSFPELVHHAREIWFDLNPATDWEEAFRGHPRIGDDPIKLREKFHSTSGDWAMGEQSNAMATATEGTLKELGEMNVKYEEKFGRIFIICATGVTAEFVLANVKDRMENSPWAEMMVAAREQMKITELRLKKLNLRFNEDAGQASSSAQASSMKKRVKILNEQTSSSTLANSEKKKSPITTHVLDTALGKPAEGIKVTLNNRSSAAPWISKEGYTNADGRVTDLMGGDETLFAGDYELVFHVQEYVRMTTGQKSFYPECPIRFTVFQGRTKEHYHVPLLLNPFGYGTYRGS
jgi:5-hydroxyisourate hydrolase/2-oxo-4-hydroxy-4-carboxy-5-ureidoimidazoline decarboxylase